ncbi:carboxypeptidase-like regulatory domain-containing protein [Mongoliitalea daihaiensis]|uniref:carboxypeptidase-like regulatory domain-containing protein n=1 Tax=Mongoliitalea daihaiensis TaxID=2782006 RepID=UPI001F1F44B8|nr:carboxypeptidase-like regulatory domain-containing protein [Mongoliitalea daihaiensis]UJP66024.1 carboxypeptidase-like regulatory domain-containing protein [Mongoliitalea daihaiensis]
MKRLIIFLFWITLGYSATCAQGLVRGLVLDHDTQEPLPFATVFLSNTTFGQVTDKDGKFSIASVPAGEYEIIVSFMGYQTFQQLIEIKNDIPLQLELRVKPTVVDLQEKLVEEKRDKSWYKNLKIFEQYFLGTSMNAKKSVILNPNVLIMDDQQKPGYLLVSAKEPIMIENPNLGYQISFVLKSFECNPKEERWSYYGYPYFEELEVPVRRKSRISKNRDRAYYGSLTHFLQAVYQDSLEKEGFEVYLVNRIKGEDQLYQEVVSDVQVNPMDMVLRDEEGNTFFHYRKPIFVRYNHETEEIAFSMRYNQDRAPIQTSKFILLVHRIRLESDGRYFPASGIYTEGYMAWERVADLMPYGYTASMQRENNSTEKGLGN